MASNLCNRAVPGKVAQVLIVGVGSNYVSLTWQPPAGNDVINSYEVDFWLSDVVSNTSAIMTILPNITLHGLLSNRLYTFRVRFLLNSYNMHF